MKAVTTKKSPIPGSVRSKMLPAISDLIDKLGVTFKEPSSLPDAGSLHNSGFYQPAGDFICVHYRPARYDVNLVTLHEIAHWTGAEDRLARTVVVEAGYGRRVFGEERETEEAVAQIAAVELAKHFGVAEEALVNEPRRHLAYYPLADLDKARRLAQMVVEFVLARK